MNPGELRERAELLTLTQSGNAWGWTVEKRIWCKYAETGRKNLFSRVGVGQAGAEIIIREIPIDCGLALRVRGQHLFLTDVTRTGIAPVYLKVQAAMAPAAESSRMSARRLLCTAAWRMPSSEISAMRRCSK